MSKMLQVWVVLFCVAVGSYGFTQDKDKKEKEAEKEGKQEVEVSEVLTGSITHLRRIVMPLALAMPDDKYGFAPTNGEFKGVRTFGQQVKHMAATNFIYASAILGEKPPVDVGEQEDGPASVKTKDEIQKYLVDSFTYVLKAVDTINEKNVTGPIKNPFGLGTTTRLAMATLIIGHCYDHYGQMVEYVRMNGIVPPASQR